MLSCLKNFATDPLMRTVSIDRYYHPNARMSFANVMPRMEEEYKEMLNKLVESIKG